MSVRRVRRSRRRETLYSARCRFNSLEAVIPARDPLIALPTDPRRLSSTLRGWAWRQRVKATDRDRCTLGLSGCTRSERRLIQDAFTGDIATLLRYPLTPPQLRSSLLEVFAELDGARSLGRLHDPLGREGVAIELPGSGLDGNRFLLFDPKTSQLLAVGAHGPHTINGRSLRLAGDNQPTTSATIRWQQLYRLRTGDVSAVGNAPRPHG